MMSVSRHFVTVDGRQVHYRRTGAGPPIVAIHGAGRSSISLEPLLESVGSVGLTGVALDLPGHGLSEPLSAVRPTINDYAAAVGAALEALGIARCALFGSHAGASVALALARQVPERVTGLVLERLPLLSDQERTEFLERYAPEFKIEADGSHLLRRWAFLRDEYVFHPWYRRERSTRVVADLPPAEELAQTLLDQARVHDYRVSYLALFRFNEQVALREARAPMMLMAVDGDAFATRAERVPPGLRRPSLVQLGSPTEALVKASEFLKAHAVGEVPALPGIVLGRPNQLTCTYASTPWGQLFVRFRVDTPGRPIVLLHPSWMTGAIFEELIDALARFRPVYALDRLAVGDSDKPDLAKRPELEWLRISDFVGADAAAVNSLGLEEIDLIGSKAGALMAAELAISEPEHVHVRKVILDTVPLFEASTRKEVLANWNVDASPRLDGSHLSQVWDRGGRSSLWYPYHQSDRAHARDGPIASPEQLHNSALVSLKAGRWFWKIAAAVYGYPIRTRLPLLKTPTLVSARSRDVLKLDSMTEAVTLVPNAIGRETPANSREDGPFPYALGVEAAAFYLNFLDAAT
jgi:pimeloyl-ACP methyl ester carboxylesterase